MKRIRLEIFNILSILAHNYLFFDILYLQKNKYKLNRNDFYKINHAEDVLDATVMDE
jgi:hypothetical protein